MQLDELLNLALTGLAAAYYENLNYEPKYAKLFCRVYAEALDMDMDVSTHESNYDELKGIE